MASDREIAVQKRIAGRESADRARSATASPGRSSGGGGFEPAHAPTGSLDGYTVAPDEPLTDKLRRAGSDTARPRTERRSFGLGDQ